MSEKIMTASKVGFPCDRNLYYAVNGFKGEVKESSQRIFDVGSALEPLIVKWLNQDGWRVFYNPGSQSAALEFYAPINGGKIGGHPDAFMSKLNCDNVLVDIKTMNERAFISWKRNGTIKDKPQYADQLHVYAYAAKLAGFPVDKLNIAGTHNLAYNASVMVREGLGILITIEGIINNRELVFIPLQPEIKAGLVLAWKKEAVLSKAAKKFLEILRSTYDRANSHVLP